VVFDVLLNRTAHLQGSGYLVWPFKKIMMVIMVLEARRTKTGNTRYEYVSIVLGVGLPDHHQI